MDYKYIHPLFNEDDKEEAMEYLAKRMASQISVLGSDGSINMSSEFVDNTIRECVHKMYGVNAVSMANMCTVQDVFIDYYSDSILKYLHYCGVNASLIYYTPSSVVPYVLNREIKKGNFTPINRFDPSEKWDLHYTNDTRQNIVNPLNGFLQVHLYFKDITNDDFIKSVMSSMKTAYSYDKLRKCRAEGLPVNLMVGILPNTTFCSINNLVQIIHSYF